MTQTGLTKKGAKMAEKLDLRKELKTFYNPSARQVEVVSVPRFQFAMVDGQIERGLMPGTSPDFQEAVQALYNLSYTLKFMSKLSQSAPLDYSVMALEGLWWVEGAEFSFEGTDPWAYTAMILQPAHITPDLYAEALQQMRKKKGDLPGFARLRLEPFEEGLAVQIMHKGPYSTEKATIEKMDAFANENGYRMHGKHHEIYLGDPLRSQPEKLKTILRHPVMQ